MSVVIPAHNAERYLAEAIRSVLAQTYGHVEIVVVNDGSTDATAEVARSFGDAALYREVEQGGAAAARNHGIRAAHGKLIAFLDADDLWTPDKLRLQVDALHENPHVGLVFGHVEQFHSPELDEATRARIHCPVEPAPGYLPSAMLARRDCFDQAGYFETQWSVGEFISWYARAQEAGIQSMMLPRVVARRRLHTTNQMAQKRDADDYAYIVKALLDRRRGKSNS